MAWRGRGDWRWFVVAVVIAALVLGLGFVLRAAGLGAAANVAQLVSLAPLVVGLANWPRAKRAPVQPPAARRESSGPIFDKAAKAESIFSNLSPRNAVFTGQVVALDTIKHIFEGGSASVVAICGLGGVGKSQLALEYAYRARQWNDYWLECWIRADSPSAIVEDLAKIGSLAGLTIGEFATAEAEAEATATVIGLTSRSNWLVVFDNADRPEAVASFLPGGDGHVIITARSRGGGGLAANVSIEGFSRVDAVEFLERRTDQHGSRDAPALAEALGDLPLALAQAAAFIVNNNMTISDYFELYQDIAASRRLRAAGLDAGEYPRSVAATWLLHFERLRKDYPAAADLLTLFSFLDPDDINVSDLPVETGRAGRRLKKAMADPFERTRTIGALIETNLVTRISGEHVRVHRLVQAVARDELNRRQTYIWLRRAIKLVTARPFIPRSGSTLHATSVVAHAENYGMFSRRSRAIQTELISEYIPVGPSGHIDVARGPAQLLDPRLQVVAFTGREAELASLHAWCMSSGATRTQLITGPGGVGKTRLALALADRLRDAGWLCLVVGEGQEAGVVTTVRGATRGPVLLIVDYAETRFGLSSLLASAVADRGSDALRILLLARGAGEWWDRLQAAGGSYRSLIADVEPDMLANTIAPGLSDEDIISQAVSYYAGVLGVPRPSEPHLAMAEKRSSVLELHAAALVAVLQSVNAPDPMSVALGDLMGVLLRHEERFWLGTAQAMGLLDGPEGLTFALLRQIVAVGTLLGAADEQEALELLRRVPGAPHSRKITQWLKELYPPAVEAREWLGSLQPDLLAELHVVIQLMGNPEFARWCLTGLTERQGRRAVTLIIRALADYDFMDSFGGHFPDLVELVADIRVPLETLIPFVNVLPDSSSSLSNVRCKLERRLLDGLSAGAYPGERAALLIAHAHTLSQLGRTNEVLSLHREAVSIYRNLNSTGDGRGRHNLADALYGLSDVLIADGQIEAARKARDEADQLAQEG